MIDRRELDYLEAEYIQIALAELTDDVDCSPSTLQTRDNRLNEITILVGTDISESWQNMAIEKAKVTGFASGRAFNE